MLFYVNKTIPFYYLKTTTVLNISYEYVNFERLLIRWRMYEGWCMRTGCSEEYANFGGGSQKKQKVQMMIFIILKLCVLCILHIFTTYNQQMHNIQG